MKKGSKTGICITRLFAAVISGANKHIESFQVRETKTRERFVPSTHRLHISDSASDSSCSVIFPSASWGEIYPSLYRCTELRGKTVMSNEAAIFKLSPLPTRDRRWAVAVMATLMSRSLERRLIGSNVSGSRVQNRTLARRILFHRCQARL